MHRYAMILTVCVLVLMGLPMTVAAESPSVTEGICDSLTPISCSRVVRNSTLDIHIMLESKCEFDLNVTGVLYPPSDYILPTVVIQGNPYSDNESGIQLSNSTQVDPFRGALIVRWGRVGARSVADNLEPFRIPINKSLAVPNRFMMNLTYGLCDDGTTVNTEIMRTFEIMPKEWSVTGGSVASANKLEITGWFLEDGTLYKGEGLEFTFEIHSNHYEPLGVYLNVKIRELTKLYIGFHLGVWAFPDPGLYTGYLIYPSQTIYITATFGPFLHDTNRGYWALNGALSVTGVPNQPPQIVPVNYQVTDMKAYGWNGGGAGYFSPSVAGPSFTVQQNPSVHEILVAVVNDQWTYYVGTTFLFNAVHHSFRVGQGMNLGPSTNLCNEFGLDFNFLHVGTYSWDTRLDGVVDSGAALEATIYQLGTALGIGGAWVGAETFGNPFYFDYNQGYTMRENHGFDIGLGVMGAGYEVHSGEGRAWQLGSACVAMGNYLAFLDASRIEECAVHELCHLFGAIHGADSVPPFGDQQGGDGYTYIMAGGTGYDIYGFPFTEWRMHSTTRDRINGYYHRYKFDGAAIPQQSGAYWYGQVRGYAYIAANPAWSQVHYWTTDGKYYWGTSGSSHYNYFTIATETKYIEDSPPLQPRYRLAQRVRGNIDYAHWQMGLVNFYVGYDFSWSSSYWPYGFSPSSTTVWLYFDGCIWQSDSSGGLSTVDNVELRVLSDKSTTPVQYYSDWFRASIPGTKWARCDSRWGGGSRGDITVNDVTTQLLFGFNDAWRAEWNQQIYLHFQRAVYYFWYTSWQ